MYFAPTHSDIKTIALKKQNSAISFEPVAFTDVLLVMSSMMIIEIDLARDQESPAISLVSSGHFGLRSKNFEVWFGKVLLRRSKNLVWQKFSVMSRRAGPL